MSIQKSSFFSFKDDISTKGTLKNSYFEVDFFLSPNHYMGTAGNSTLSTYTVRCEAAAVPGVSLATIDGIPQYGYGPIETNPYGALFDPLALVFSADQNSDIYKFFFTWINHIVKFDIARTGVQGPETGRQPYEVGYKDKYMCDMRVRVFKHDGTLSKSIKIFKAYPKGINNIDLDWNQTESVMKIMIPFSYRDFLVE